MEIIVENKNEKFNVGDMFLLGNPEKLELRLICADSDTDEYFIIALPSCNIVTPFYSSLGILLKQEYQLHTLTKVNSTFKITY